MEMKIRLFKPYMYFTQVRFIFKHADYNIKNFNFKKFKGRFNLKTFRAQVTVNSQEVFIQALI